MQERRRQEGPEDVDDEDQTAGQVEREAVVLVRRDLGAGAWDGLRRAEGTG